MQDRHRPSARDLVVGISPFGRADPALVAAVARAGALGVLDLTAPGSEGVLGPLAEDLGPVPFGIRAGPRSTLDPAALPAGVDTVVLTGPRPGAEVARWAGPGRLVLVEVRGAEEADEARAAGAAGLVARGSEGGGPVGDETTLVLLSRLVRPDGLPAWAAGGLGEHSAAGALALGAAGVVFDAQLALTAESGLPEEVRRVLAVLDGSETEVLGGHRVLVRPGLRSARLAGAGAEEVASLLGADDLGTQVLPAGQEVAQAAGFARRWVTAGGAVEGLRRSLRRHLTTAARLDPLAEGGPLAAAHGLGVPVAQGPMTRVSDRAAFAQAVAQAGALPFLALSLMTGPEVEDLLEETAALLGPLPFGVGVLGFVPPEVRQAQLEVIARRRPAVALIAGGRPAQARPLEEAGIATYLHVPSPGLLARFVKDGARRFVFEGRECGGHVGPRSSFALWDAQVATLLESGAAPEVSVLFAGGVHDGATAAAVAATAAPLAEAGAKVGVLMGTAYLFTEEAVAAGAVVPGFQRAALECQRTVLLETAPGHATRCAESPYAAHFRAERDRLEESGTPPDEIWAALEGLNLGRLRVASKGLGHAEEGPVALDEAEQAREGLYMLGEVAALHRTTTTAAALHRSVSAGGRPHLVAARDRLAGPLPARPSRAPVALVGLACAFPGAPDAESFWAEILAGDDAVTEVPAARFDVARYYDPEAVTKNAGERTPSRWGGFLPDIGFDALAFGLPPRSLAAIEPVQLLSLQVAADALADAGYGPDSGRDFDRERASVVFGAEAGTDLASAYGFRALAPQFLGGLPEALDQALPRLTEDSFPGLLTNVIAGRIANRLDLGGVNFTVDAACASSLAALDAAVKELQGGTSDLVLCGGADLHNGVADYLLFAAVHALSPTGRCASFDAKADGITLGEGVACVVLKRLDDARRDGDRVYAVIEGVAGSSDGRSLGLTAPRPEGQRRALTRAYEVAGRSPATVGLVEAHGTGTVVGDRTELAVLTELFAESGAGPGACALGSVKSQIGHTKCAAGLASLIKVARALYHGVRPPTIHLEEPNPGWVPEASPFAFHTEAAPWPDAERVAGVSAFGFGGTNFHAVLRRDEDGPEPPGPAQWPAELVCLRGPDAGAAAALAGRLSAWLARRPAGPAGAALPRRLLRDLAATAWAEGEGPVRAAFVARDLDDLAAKLSTAAAALTGGALPDDAGVHLAPGAPADGTVAFLFPGQGSQRPGLSGGLFVAFPFLQRHLRANADLLDRLYPPAAFSEEGRRAQQAAVTDTEVAQPALGLSGLALAELLGTLGVRPDMAAGHSYGELVALCVAGALPESELPALSAARAAAIVAAAGEDPGAMAAVSAGAEEVARALAGHPEVVVANDNAPGQVVVSGPTPALEAAVAALKTAGLAARRLNVACAFHSPVVAGAEAALARALAGVALAPPAVPVYSNETARPHDPAPEALRAALAHQVAAPVHFVDEVRAMHAAGARVFVEVGPGKVLSGLVGRILSDEPHRTVTLDPDGRGDLPRLLEALAQLVGAGVTLEAAPLYRGRTRTLDLEAGPAVPGWLVNGHLVRTAAGAVVDGALPPADALPPPGPLTPAALAPAAPAPGADGPVVSAARAADPEADGVVADYLETLRQAVAAGRDVVLSYLGAARPAAPDRPTVEARAEPLAPPSAPAAAPEAPTPAPTPALGPAEVRAAVVATVSERTGYPAEMLEGTLDLEADLSIDSIKRLEIVGELAERLSLGVDPSGSVDESVVEELVSVKTLDGIVEWLTAALSSAPAAAAPEAPTPAPTPALGPAEVRAAVVATVSERTGYPAEMLEGTLDLEADLSIDSIKRLEIVGELAERLSLGVDPSGSVDESVVEELVSVKTLDGIVEWLTAALSSASGRPAPEPAAPADGVGPAPAGPGGPAVPEGARRFVPRLVEVAAPEPGPIEGRRVVLTDDGRGVAPLLAALLREAGAEAAVVPPGRAMGEADVLVHLEALGRRSGPGALDLLVRVQEALAGGVSTVVAATSLDGELGYGTGPGLEAGAVLRGGGLRGVVRTLGRELPWTRARVVDLAPGTEPAAAAALLAAEVRATDGLEEVGWKDGRRTTLEVVAAEAPVPAGTGPALGPDSVVLVTGGARGVTSAVARALGARGAGRVVLAGRTPLPEGDEDPATATAPDAPALRRTLAQAGFGGPPAIEAEVRRLLAAREVRRTLTHLRDGGTRVEYRRADLSDPAEAAALLAGVRADHGRLDVVVHGAGILEDTRLVDKEVDSFRRVYDTKVTGAVALLDGLPDDVGAVVLFASVSGLFGNAGQVDYAAANEVLGHVARSLQARHPGCKVVAVDWGPWGGGGMVSAELEREFARRGVGLLDPGDAVSRLLEEMGRPDPDPEVVLMRATPGPFARPDSPEAVPAAPGRGGGA